MIDPLTGFQNKPFFYPEWHIGTLVMRSSLLMPNRALKWGVFNLWRYVLVICPKYPVSLVTTRIETFQILRYISRFYPLVGVCMSEVEIAPKWRVMSFKIGLCEPLVKGVWTVPLIPRNAWLDKVWRGFSLTLAPYRCCHGWLVGVKS